MRDIRVKADRADSEGSFLGWFLAKLQPGSSVGLIGFSYGARIVSGGLQLLGGGVLNGHTLPEPPSGLPLRLRAVYLAAAMDRNWIHPSGYHGQSLSPVESVLITYNRCDPALRRFRFTEPCGRPTALGYAGVYSGSLGEAAGRVEQIDVSSVIGRTHRQAQYWNSSLILSEVCRVIFTPFAEPAPLPLQSSASAAPQTSTVGVPEPVSSAAVEDDVAKTADPTTEPASVEPHTSNDESTPSASHDEAGRRFQRSGRYLRRARR
jgi:hypothetical protein